MFRLTLKDGPIRQPVLETLRGGNSQKRPSARELISSEKFVVGWLTIPEKTFRGQQSLRQPEDDARTDRPQATSRKDVLNSTALKNGYVSALRLEVISHSGEYFRLAVPVLKHSEGARTAGPSPRATGSPADNDLLDAQNSEEEVEADGGRIDRCHVVDYVDLHEVSEEEW